MHIPDNYLSPSTDAVLVAAMVPVWVHSVRTVRRTLDQRHIAFLGVAAAFSFLLMMFNVPLPGGTTGHAVGGTLIALILGPEAACIAVTVALAIQALLFGDGGILAFGANCFNMAFVLPFVGYGVYRLVAGRSATAPAASPRRTAAIAIGSYAGINAAALCTAIEFGIQPTLFHDAAGLALYCPYPLAISIPAMLVPHLLVAGVVEAVATVAIFEFVSKTAPEYIVAQDVTTTGVAVPGAATPATSTSENTVAEKPVTSSLVPVALLVVALAVATPLGLLAQGDAWGEWGAADFMGATGLAYVPAGLASGFSFDALLPDYSLAGLPQAAGYVLSAVIGAALLVIIFKLVGAAAGRGASNAASSAA